MQTNQLTALIIDDSEIIRDRLAELLYEVAGVNNVGKAANAIEGLKLASACKPMLVVLDLRMPGMGGIEILEKIKHITPSPVVSALTNYPNPSYRKRCVELGADYFFDKSSEFNEIKSIMKELILSKERNGYQNRSTMKLKAVKILLAEDNEMSRDILSRRLTRQGYDVVVAVNGPEALAKATSEHPDLVLMDLGLPDVDGWEITRRLKGDSATRNIPVIALTAHAMQSERAAAFAAGCDDFDIKPVDFPRLLEKIESQLHVVRAQ